MVRKKVFKIIASHYGCTISILPCLYITISVIMGVLFPFIAYGETLKYADTRIAYFKQKLYSDTISSKIKLNYYDSLMYLLPEERPKLLLGKAKVLRDMDQHKYLKEAIKLYEDISNMEKMYPISEHFETLYTMGNLYLQLGEPVKALRMSEKILSYPLPDSLGYYKVKTYTALGNIFTYLEDDEKLESVINKGLTLIEAERDKIPDRMYLQLKSGILTQKAYLNYIKGEYSEAFELYSEAKRLYPPFSARIDLNTGGLFGTQNQHDIARKYFMEALTSSSNYEIRAIAAFNMVLDYAKTKQYDKMLDFANQYRDDLKYLTNRIQDAKVWGLKSEAYESFGNYREALYAQRMADSIRNEVMPPEKIRELEREYVQITLAEKDAEMKETVKRGEKKAVWLWISVGFCVIAAGVIIWLLIRLRKHGDTIAQGEQEREKEKEEYHQRKEEMDSTLELRNQEMSSMAMKLASMSEKMETLKEIVSDPKAKKGDIVAAVQSTLREVSSDGEVWDAFMGYFEEVNQSFFDRLYHLHPDLTNAETRMCAFILLNRTNKEIASILHRSARTVETIKYNLRKKLGITESTESYLRSISAGEKGKTVT